MKKVSIAGLQDVPQLLLLINSAYRGEAAKKGWTHEAELIEGELRADEGYLKELIEDPTAVILKYTEDDTIKGCVYLQKQGHKVYLGMLSVTPTNQTGGIGKLLLNASEDWALSRQATSIIMNVISVRKELIEWYERRGYKDSGIRNPFPDEKRFGVPRKPVEFMVMEKTLVS